MIMPSTSEVGHAKNVANLQKLIEQVTVYTLYNPPVESLMVPNLPHSTLQPQPNLMKSKKTQCQQKRHCITPR